MTTEDDARFPVQDTARDDKGCYFEEPPLSIEETPPKPKISAKYKSRNVDKTLETNVDVKSDNRAIEDRGPDRKPSTCKGQGHVEFSCNGPNGNASEDKRKTLEDTSVQDNVFTAFQQDGSNTMSCALENDALIVPVSGTIVKEKNVAPEGHSLNNSTTEFSEAEDNTKDGYRPSDEKCAIPGQNASNFKTADSKNIVEDTTITGGKLQGGGDMENKSAIDLENETSTDRGGDNHDSNINETDVKEEEEKSDVTSSMANATKGSQQDVTKDIRLDGHAAMTLKSEDSRTILEEKTLTWQGNRSNDSTPKLFESGRNGDVGYRSSDDVLAHHEGNICSPLVCQTGRHTSSECIGCNQSTTILKIDVGTSTDPYDGGSKSKKRRRNKCRADNVSIDRNPEDNISSGQKISKIKYQNQAPVIEKSPKALATTSDTSFQQDGNVSVITKPGHHTPFSCASENYTTSGSQIEGEGPSRASKPSSGTTVLWNASNICRMIFKMLVVLIIVASTMAQASPVSKQWQQFQFCRKDGTLNDQLLTIINMEDRTSEPCTVFFTSVPFFKNCSESRALVFVENPMCVDMLTDDLTTEDWSMECGNNRNGESLPAARRGRVNEKSVWKKLAEYTEPANGSAQRLSAEDNARTDDSRRQKLWQQFRFHMTDGSLIDQVLTITDMHDRRSAGCTLTVPAVPFFKNCSESGFLVFVKNETWAEMLTEKLTAEDWRMEYGNTRNGDGLPAARGGMLNEKSVKDKIIEYTETADSRAQRPPDQDDTRTAYSQRQQLWQQFRFHMMDGSMIDQVLTITDMQDRHSAGCTFTVPAVPFFKNCSQSGFLVFVKNETWAEILTKDVTTEDLRMEYGNTRNGDGLPAARGGMLNEKSVMEKIAEYTEPVDGSAQGRSAEDIVKITAGVGVPLLILLALFLLYIFCETFNSWVNENVCRRGRRNPSNVHETGANLESNTNEMLLVQKTSKNGTTDGGLQNGESKSETLSAGLLEPGHVETETTT